MHLSKALLGRVLLALLLLSAILAYYLSQSSKPDHRYLSALIGSPVTVSKAENLPFYVVFSGSGIYITDKSTSFVMSSDGVFDTARSEFLSEAYFGELGSLRSPFHDRLTDLPLSRPLSQVDKAISNLGEMALQRHFSEKQGVTDAIERHESPVRRSLAATKPQPKPQRVEGVGITPVERVTKTPAQPAPLLIVPSPVEQPVKPASLLPSKGIHEIAQELSVNDVNFDDKCLALAFAPSDLAELDGVFSSMTKEVATKCGALFAVKALPALNDESFIIYKADNEKRVVFIVSDYTCPFCMKSHKQIPQLNDAGVTVKVLPYGRYPYFDRDGNLTAAGINNMLALCPVDNSERMTRFATLGSNPQYYLKNALEFDSSFLVKGNKCFDVGAAHKILGKVFSYGGTPSLISDDGRFNEGYLQAPEMLKFAGI